MQTWIMIGDSIMSSIPPSTLNGSPGSAVQLPQHLLAEECGITVRNISSPGASLGAIGRGGYGNIVPALDTIAGAWNFTNGLIITAGTNDFGTSVSGAAHNEALRKIMAWAKRSGKKVLLMDIPYRQDENKKNKVGLNLGAYRFARAIIGSSEYKGTCYFANRQGTVFDTFTQSLYDPREVAAGKALHLNAEGLRAFTDWIKSAASTAGYF